MAAVRQFVTHPPVSRRLHLGRKPLWALLLVAYLGGSLWVAHSSLYVQGLILVAAVFAVVALSLDLAIGATGMFSLGHAGLLAVGAYVTTVLWTQFGTNIFLLLPVAIVASALCGFTLGTASLRVGGLQFAIITFIFTLIMTTLVSNIQITGGADGLLGPTSPEWPRSLNWLGSTTCWIVMMVFLVGVAVTWSVRRSPLYPVLLAIRDAERFAEAAGARVEVIRIGIFTLSGALVGLAGWSFSLLGAVSPDQFTWIQSANMLIMVLLGGINTALGPIVGAAFVSMVPATVGLQSYVDDVLFGTLMVAVVILFPKGVVGSLTVLFKRVVSRLKWNDANGADTTLTSNEAALNELYASKDGEPIVLPELPENALAVECKGVTFRYPGSAVRALANVDLNVRAGSIHGLIGPNGSGKSTLIDVISGRRRTESGTVVVNGEVVDGRASQRARLGFMRTFQSATLVNELSGLSNVVVGAYSRLRRIAARAPLWALLPGTRDDFTWLRDEASVALKAVGVGAEARSAVADVPQAVRQLVQLAAVCVARPTTLVLDEPLAGLSVGEVEHVKKVLGELQTLGVTVIIVEHQTQFVFDVCDRVTVLNSGELVVSGDAATVRSDDRVREVYLGLPAEVAT